MAGMFPKSFGVMERREWIDHSQDAVYDVAIVGGGITGAGIANILSQNGLKIILLEKGDFASGTSSGSSKLIHGGLRYLANLHLREVRTLLKERNYLSKNTDIVKFMNFRILIDPYSWKRETMRLGLITYNILSGNPEFPRIKRNNGEYGSEVRGYFTYRDAWSDDCRLTIYNILSAVNAGARCLNYARVVSIKNEGNTIRIDAEDSVDKRKFSVTARYGINAAGPWSKKVYDLSEGKNDISLKLSKGVHIVVPAEKAKTRSAIVFRSHLDQRQMFIIPRGEVTIIGTTDKFLNDPDDFSVSEEDVNYIVSSARRIFPSLSEEDVTYSYAGIRPLFGNGDDPGSISRGFVIRESERMIHIFGGKLTDYRYAARRVASIYGKKTDLKLRIRSMPLVNYSRPHISGKELYLYEMNHECALYPEDIVRRREAFDVYRKDRGNSEIDLINSLFKDRENAHVISPKS
ncbi:MAG: glycerol-3-phosphate dehydrogenase/oxidase [Cuniculiplasma sp.]